MPLDTRIALGGQPLQLESPVAQYGQLMNVVNAGTQNQLAQMQMQENQQMAPLRMQEAQSKAAMSKLTLDQAVEARDFLTKTMKAAEENSNGTAPKDPLAVIKAFLGHPNKQVQDVGTHMANAYQLIQDFEADQRYATAKGGGVAPMAPPSAAPAAPAAPMVAASTAQMMPVPAERSVNALQIGDGSVEYRVDGKDVPFAAYANAVRGRNQAQGANAAIATMPAPAPMAAPVNALAPTANVNAMAAPVAKTAADIKAEIDSGDLQFGRSKRWAKERELLVDQYKEAIKPPTYYNVEGALVGRDGKPIYTAPPKTPTPSDVSRLIAERNAAVTANRPADEIADLNAAIKKAATHQPPTQISLTQNAEKSYGTAFGGKIADLDAAKLDAAGKAPDLAANANSVLSILNKGDVFVGPAATVKLNIARVLNAAGASNDEKIANTETLISNLGRNTLGMVKSSGLGTGQGFTDKDLQFLEKVAGGSIDYNEKTLRSLAELAHKAAAASAETWNKRVKEIPASATSGMGISLEPVVVPARITKAAATRPAGVPAEWTLQVDGAGKRAYVSPDGKSFKEVP